VRRGPASGGSPPLTTPPSPLADDDVIIRFSRRGKSAAVRADRRRGVLRILVPGWPATRILKTPRRRSARTAADLPRREKRIITSSSASGDGGVVNGGDPPEAGPRR